MIAAGRHPELVDALALVCPGLHPRVGVSRQGTPRKSPGRSSPIAERPSRSRFRTLRFSRTTRRARRSSPADPLACGKGPPGCWPPASSSTAWSRRRPPASISRPCLMLAGQDRIVDNARTLAYFERLASTKREVIEYPEGHHTLEFDPDPSRYARSRRLARSSFSAQAERSLDHGTDQTRDAPVEA